MLKILAALPRSYLAALAFDFLSALLLSRLAMWQFCRLTTSPLGRINCKYLTAWTVGRLNARLLGHSAV